MFNVELDNTLISNLPKINNQAVLLMINGIWNDLDRISVVPDKYLDDELEMYLPTTIHTSWYNNCYVLDTSDMVIYLTLGEYNSNIELINELKKEIYLCFHSLWLSDECCYLGIAGYNSMDNFVAEITHFDNTIDYIGYLLKQY